MVTTDTSCRLETPSSKAANGQGRNKAVTYFDLDIRGHSDVAFSISSQD